MFFLVYRITNVVNGKHYTGAHSTVNKDDGYFGSSQTLKFAIAKYGKSSFVKSVLCECSNKEEMFAKEKELVLVGPNSYNIKAGGHGGWDHVTTEQKRMAGRMNRGNKNWLGLSHTDETKLKMSLAKVGKKRAPFSDEWRANLVASRKGKIRGPYRKKQNVA